MARRAGIAMKHFLTTEHWPQNDLQQMIDFAKDLKKEKLFLQKSQRFLVIDNDVNLEKFQNELYLF